MKRFWGIRAMLALVVLVLSSTGTVRAQGRAEPIPPSPSKYVDLGLTPAQEESLAFELYSKGLLRKGAELTSEEKKQYHYLTRPVPIKSEAVPGGLIYNLLIAFKPETAEAEVEALLADLDHPEIVSERRRPDGSPWVLYLCLPRDDISMEKIPNDLREIISTTGKPIHGELDPTTGLTPNTEWTPIRHPCISYYSADPFTSRRWRARKRLLIVTFQRPITDEETMKFEEEHEIAVMEKNGQEVSVFVLRGLPLAKAANGLWDELVIEVSPIGIGELRSTLPREEPNDIGWDEQWDLHQNRAATDTSYSTGADSRDFEIDGPEGWWVWSLGSFTDTAVIAVIDWGFRIDHVDLTSKWRQNPGEVVDGSDGDGNGRTDDEYHGMLNGGINLVSDTTIERTDDSEGHGIVDIFTHAM